MIQKLKAAMYSFVLAAVATSVGTVGSAQTTPAAKAPAANTKSAAKPGNATIKRDPSLPEGVPTGARPWKQYYWRFVDAKGAAWIYHTTPFGIVKDQETAEDRAEHANQLPKPEIPPGELTIVDKGDALEFSRQTPFGASSWTAKKTELTDQEAADWARAQARAAAKR